MLFIWVGIALGFVLLQPRDPLLTFDIVFAHHLSAVDAGYCVVLYLWMLVSQNQPVQWLAGICACGGCIYLLAASLLGPKKTKHCATRKPLSLPGREGPAL